MTKFLVDRNLWTEVARRVRAARRTYAAMAYVGQDGPTLLPLKPGDTLVVDMSLEAVRHGATNPKAIRSFIDNGVAVYPSRLLHAKTLIADAVLVVGSANASQR